MQFRTSLPAVAVSAALAVPAALMATGVANALPAKANAKAKAPTCAHAIPASAVAKGTVRPEIAGLQGLRPYVANWQRAVAARNVNAATQFGENYEAAWQGEEVYVNHRSIVLYTDTEVDTQFVLDAELEKAKPDWGFACRLVAHLGDDIETGIALAKAGPILDPAFDTLSKIRHYRAFLNVARTALTEGNAAKAQKFIGKFNQGYPSIRPLIAARSTRAVTDIDATQAVVIGTFADPNATLAAKTAAYTTFAARVGFGVNLVNAAARAADKHRTALGVTDADRTNLANLNQVLVKLNAGLAAYPTDKVAAAAGGDISASSAFFKVQPPLETPSRYIAVAPALRNALVAFAKAAGGSSQSAVTTAYGAALDQIDIARQVLVGQFWTDPALQAFLASLPTS